MNDHSETLRKFELPSEQDDDEEKNKYPSIRLNNVETTSREEEGEDQKNDKESPNSGILNDSRESDEEEEDKSLSMIRKE